MNQPACSFLPRLLALAPFLALAACSSGSSVSGNQAPVVVIESPFTGNSFVEGEEVVLSGRASDPEEGDLDGAGLEWSSDRDGPLGNGASLTIDTLSLGLHGIP